MNCYSATNDEDDVGRQAARTSWWKSVGGDLDTRSPTASVFNRIDLNINRVNTHGLPPEEPGKEEDSPGALRRRQEVLGPGAPEDPGVWASRWDGDGVPDLDSGDWDLSICREKDFQQYEI
ncbi:hypothetical protein EYF80_030121 [Liparis tanakae]|uniref:Uncharacterized protein n=1 Tax=Liparis tanakae TaxID=230148 RepID=A0A4Z2H2U5_9TELE|nr:hypothetical protein EYF80_030121 [Liparis tanakae]